MFQTAKDLLKKLKDRAVRQETAHPEVGDDDAAAVAQSSESESEEEDDGYRPTIEIIK